MGCSEMTWAGQPGGQKSCQAFRVSPTCVSTGGQVGPVSSQVSSEQRRRQDAGGKGRAEEWGEWGLSLVLSIPHPPLPVESAPGAHCPQGQCHCSSPPETQQAFRNGAFTLMPKRGVLVVLLQTLSTPSSPFLCLHSPLLVSIPSMTVVPPVPGSLQSTFPFASGTGSASLTFTHPQLPFRCQPV